MLDGMRWPEKMEMGVAAAERKREGSVLQKSSHEKNERCGGNQVRFN